MIDRQQLAALAAILREGRFEKAASVLNVTSSAISQRLKALEELCGAILVIRDTPCRATEAGEKLFRHALQIELLERETGVEMTGAAIGRPSLAVAINADSLATWFIDAIKRFADTSGGVVETYVDDEDYTAAWLRGGRVMAAVSADPRPVQGCSVEPLGALTYVAAATSAFQKQFFPNGLSAESLSTATTIVFNEKDDLQHNFIKTVTGVSGFAPPVYRLPSPQAFIDAVCAGLGWAMLPHIMAEPHLKTGKLVQLYDTPHKVNLYWICWRLKAELLKSLTDAVKETARDKLMCTVGKLEKNRNRLT